MKLDEAKLPAGTFKLRCSRCSKVFTASKEGLREKIQPAAEAKAHEPERPEQKVPEPKPPEPEPASAVKEVNSSAEWERIQASVEEMIRMEVDSAKKEILGSLGSLLHGVAPSVPPSAAPAPKVESDRARRVLICENDKSTAEAIALAWNRLGYAADFASSAVESVRKLDMAFYHAVSTELSFPDEPEGGKNILAKLNSQKPDQRRNIFIAIISNNIKTTDPDNAFFHGANITVNKNELLELERLVVDGQKYHEALYQNYSEIVAETAERL